MNTKKRFTKVMMFVLVFTIIASSTFTAFGAAGRWIKSGSRWWYKHTDSSYTTNDWEKINNKWYHFDGKGWMQTGWLKVSGKWYYLNPNGDMATGWKKVKGKWYYLNSNGAMATGWKKVKGEWYYLNSNGDMATGWKKVGNVWYYLEEDGVMLADDFLYYKDNFYYLKSNGAMATKWNEIYGDWYYFDNSGIMAYNKWIGSYYVNYDGIWIEDTSINIDGSYSVLAIAYFESDNYDAYTMRGTDDSEVIKQFASYVSQLKPTLKQSLFETESSIYDAVFFNTEDDYVNVMILEDDGVLIYNDVMYDIDVNQVKNIWNSCIDIPME